MALDESFLVARLDDSQRVATGVENAPMAYRKYASPTPRLTSPPAQVEAAGFEKAKAGLDGLHFVVVQRPDDDGVEPAGFWLLREMATA